MSGRLSRAIKHRKWSIILFPLLISVPILLVNLVQKDTEFLIPVFVLNHLIGVIGVAVYFVIRDRYDG